MLTELQVKTAKPKEKYYMLRDDRGLYLRVDTSGKNTGFSDIQKIKKPASFHSVRILMFRSKRRD